MAEAKYRPYVEVEVTLKLNEHEAKALGALAGYGTDGFLKVFYEKMGRHYLEPHEAGLRSLFETIRGMDDQVGRQLRDARDVLRGVKATIPIPQR